MSNISKFVDHFVIELSKDKSDGSYYHAWQSNIAMAFYDQFLNHFGPKEFGASINNVKASDLHKISNDAAKRFLDQMIRTAKPKKSLFKKLFG